MVTLPSPSIRDRLVGAVGGPDGVDVTEVNEVAPFPAPFTALK